MAANAEDVRRGCASIGVVIDDGVLAYVGASPAVIPPWTNIGLLTTRQRLLTRVGDHLTLWTAYSGPTPGKKLHSFGIAEFGFHGPGRRWDSIFVGQLDLWTRAHDRAVIAFWLQLVPE